MASNVDGVWIKLGSTCAPHIVKRLRERADAREKSNRIAR